ncbi:M20/M25/M40 family metallo-hydrolase [Segetibacter sp. 3557_3]|uniref:M28 family metallopeptidase n=1 Tax=Segetibacter sp. 3557_3 TaxID=2547429 RepID=UPI001058820B|nr:M20/M25/M40 family metallo-hydrolase [Segetibacter sp. 3557_3]TDH27391.1 M20/M25/M40 family metallo-hydrolase [Segetibacter sp. 3557_3]
MRKFDHFILALLVAAPLGVCAQNEKTDLATVQRIRQEEMNRSQVMDIAFQLTDVSGPRLTVSPGFSRAANYALQQLKSWGLTNAILDPWGDFGKGWELQKSYVAMTAPYYKPLIGIPKAWSAGTNGPKSAAVLLVSAKDSAALEGYRGKLAGKVVLLERNDTYRQSFTADANRYTDEELQKMTDAKLTPRVPVDTAALRRRREQFAGQRGALAVPALLKAMAKSEGAIAVLSATSRSHDGTVFVQGGGAYKATDPENLLDVALANEDYMSIMRLAKSGTPVSLEMDVKTRFTTDDTKGYNVIAEIKGTDSKLKDEVVMLGGHLDSWHGGTGATDNAAGCSIMMEAVRLIQTLGLKPKRTIRIALWSGEEQGLFGSRGYVKKTFGDPATMQLLPAHEKFSAYFNLDNGTGKVRGIYLQGNEAARNVFTNWLQPFADSGSKTVTINNTGGTDHLAFDAVGLPGFQFIQDEIEYDTRTHHSNMDTYDHLIESDLKQSAAIVAAFVYNAAMRDEKIPRKELPKASGN